MTPSYQTDAAPAHVGLILDGNRRWAKSQGLASLEGHIRGYHNLRTIARHFIAERGVSCLSAYVFSTENWRRSAREVSYLMKLVSRALGEYLDEFHRDNIRIVVLGSRRGLKQSVLASIEKAESATAGNTGGTLALCFNYGGQQEITDALKAALSAKKPPRALSAEEFQEYLYNPEIPPLDLIIRTSGEQRLSGFMLFRSAYAELYFTAKHWPAFTVDDADAALAEFARRRRRFGR